MLGPALTPPLFIHSQDVFRLLPSLFCPVPVVEGVFGDFWAPSCGTPQRPTAPFFLEKHHGSCGAGAALSQRTSHSAFGVTP